MQGRWVRRTVQLTVCRDECRRRRQQTARLLLFSVLSLRGRWQLRKQQRVQGIGREEETKETQMSQTDCDRVTCTMWSRAALLCLAVLHGRCRHRERVWNLQSEVCILYPADLPVWCRCVMDWVRHVSELHSSDGKHRFESIRQTESIRLVNRTGNFSIRLLRTSTVPNGIDSIVEVRSLAAAELSAAAKDDWQWMASPFLGTVQCYRKSHRPRNRVAACGQSDMLIDRWLRHDTWAWWSSASFDVGISI